MQSSRYIIAPVPGSNTPRGLAQAVKVERDVLSAGNGSGTPYGTQSDSSTTDSVFQGFSRRVHATCSPRADYSPRRRTWEYPCRDTPVQDGKCDGGGDWYYANWRWVLRSFAWRDGGPHEQWKRRSAEHDSERAETTQVLWTRQGSA